MPLSGTSSPYVIEQVADEVDLYTVLPGLPTVPEEPYSGDTDRRSWLSYESWDTSKSTIQDEKYDEEFTTVLPGLPELKREHSVVPTNIGDIRIPANLLRTVSSSKGWRPNLDLPDNNGLTASKIIAPQLTAPEKLPAPAKNRVQSVTLGTLQRAHLPVQRRLLTPEQYTSLVRKTSAPIGKEVNRVVPLNSGQDTLSALRPVASNRRRRLTRTVTDSSLSTTTSSFPRRLIRTVTDSSLSPTASRKHTPRNSLDRHRSANPATSAQDFAAGGRPRLLHSESSQRRAFSRFNFGRRESGRETRTVNLPTPDLELGPEELMAPGTEQARPSIIDAMPNFIQVVARPVADAAAAVLRRSTLVEAYEKAKIRTVQLQRKLWVQKLFEYSIYLLLVCFVYFVLIGVPLWNGAVWWLWWVVDHKFVISGGWAITIGLAIFYAFGPLFVLFEPDPPFPDESIPLEIRTAAAKDTALLIPCYKSAKIIGPTLVSALKIFPAQNIFVISNGNSPIPLDDTEEVCRPYGVNFVWSPIGSKIVAQFVGCYAAKDYKYVLMIDDDCALPANFPIVTERMTGRVKCMGYTIKSVGPEGSKGTLCQQSQDLEYKLSGIQRAFAGILGSATFAHGAIGLWDREFLVQVFYKHPGFSVSEDWFFGHAARQLGCRILMTTSIFVETETPGSLFFSSGGSRGGFGEMTVFKQRFSRWNFFFSSGIYWNLEYIFLDWKLGWWEIGAKLFVFQEIYETLLYLLSPFVLPISFIVRPAFAAYLFVATFGMYIINVVIFNEIHLRRKKERIGWQCVWLYYMPYKAVLTLVNIASCYWSLYKYATYFAKRHPKIVESEKAIEVVMRLQEDSTTASKDAAGANGNGNDKKESIGGRRLTIVAIDGAAIRRMTAASVATGGSAAAALPLESVPEATGDSSPQRNRDGDGDVVEDTDAEAANVSRIWTRRMTEHEADSSLRDGLDRDVEKGLIGEEERRAGRAIAPAPGVPVA